MQDEVLLGRAKRMRREPTPAEVVLWRHVSGSRLGGHKFRRQHVIGAAIVDLFCPAKGVIVEVDGDTHEAERDALRDAAMARLGFRTVRFANGEVMGNVEGCLTVLLSVLDERADRWSGLPHPNPSPEGEGLRWARGINPPPSAPNPFPEG